MPVAGGSGAATDAVGPVPADHGGAAIGAATERDDMQYANERITLTGRSGRQPRRTGPTVAHRSVRAGVVGLGAIAVFYAVVVGVASGSVEHLLDQLGADWWLLAPIMAGFGVQVALLSELRQRHHAAGAAAGAAGAGAGTSAAGMLACCAHHLAEFIPFLGFTGVAAALTAWRTEMLSIGLIVNAIAIGLIWRRLRKVSPASEEASTCARG